MNKYEFEGQVFVEMPAIRTNECHGCYFEDGVNLDTNDNGTTPCPHTKNIRFCDSNAPVFVLDTPEHIANYVSLRLENT
jgi:hypothetical protein